MTIEWFVPLGQTRAMTLALHSMADDARSARGCISCSVSTDIGNRGTVRYIEEWRTEDDLRHRVQSDTFSRLAALIDSAERAPRIEFRLADRTRGLDFVEEVRRSP